MSDFPPPLAWVPGLAASLQRALDCSVRAEVHPTVNQLLYKVKFTFSERQKPLQMNGIWNIFQQYAAANDAVPQDKLDITGADLTVLVGVKRRLGPPKKEIP